MNYFCDSGGVIFHVDPERVFQGSANANVINFFGAFPSNAEVLIAYKLPDGTWTTPQRMTPIAQLSSVLDGQGNAYAGWQTRIGARLKMENNAPVTDEDGNYVYEPDYRITERYGTVLVQFFVYANGGNGLGAQIATASSSFVVEKGVPIVLPDTPTDNYQELLGQILAAISDKNEQIDTNAENITALQSDISDIDSALSNVNSDISDINRNLGGIFIALGNSVRQVYAYVDPTNYILSIELLDADANIISKSSVDLPLESMVVNGDYDENVKAIVLTLQNGNNIFIPVGDLVNGLISSTEKGQPNGVASLDADGKVPLSQLPDDIGGGEITQETFNDMLVEGLTANGNTLTDEEQTRGCDWLGAVKAPTPPDRFNYLLTFNQNGEAGTLKFSASTDFNSIPQRDGIGNIKTNTPEEETDCVNLGYANANLLPINNTVTTRNQAYAKYANGNQVMWDLDNGPTANAICVRDSGGRLRIAAPLNGGDCVNLTYFDANKGTKFYLHTMTQTVDGIGTFDLLIKSTRATAYTSGEDIYNSWIAGEIDTFLNSSLGSMGTKVLKLSSNYTPHGVSGVTDYNIVQGYSLNEGAFTDDIANL